MFLGEIKRRVYLDYAATTPVLPQVRETMLPFLDEIYGNPSSLHEWGSRAKNALETARNQVACLVDARTDEVIFTSGATEANNLAILGAAYAMKSKGNHLITSAIEHKSVLGCFKFLEQQGFRVTYLKPDKEGSVSADSVKESINNETILVSVMHANNEIGTIEPIADIGAFTKGKGILFHTDAVQTVGVLPVSVKSLGVDMLSMSAHKIYGPKGAGALYVRKGVRLQPWIFGGAQERGRRPGTEPLPALAGFGKAAEIAFNKRGVVRAKLDKMSVVFKAMLLKILGDIYWTGSLEDRLPGHLSFCLKGIDAESLLVHLDRVGIGASTGSACTAGALEVSHVIEAIGVSGEYARGPLRLTMGRVTEEEDLVFVSEQLGRIVGELRASKLAAKY